MGKLFEMKQEIDKAIVTKNLDRSNVLGQLGLKSGLLLSLLRVETPDDNEKIEKLRKAVQEVIGISI